MICSLIASYSSLLRIPLLTNWFLARYGRPAMIFCARAASMPCSFVRSDVLAVFRSSLSPELAAAAELPAECFAAVELEELVVAGAAEVSVFLSEGVSLSLLAS